MSRFRSFVVFAEMRTGSNFLETNLNALDGVACLGEAFNPSFIAYPNYSELLGVSKNDRDEDPHCLLKAIEATDGALSGFRYFHDHDTRVFDAIMDDTACAKIILTRNPVESYVSLKIAQSTGQWKLTNDRQRKEAQAVFDRKEFTEHLDATQAFQQTLLSRLQATGQTAFYVRYEDLQSLDVMNGLAAFLGVSARLDALDDKLKKQNPSALSTKVANYPEMEDALSRIDPFKMGETPGLEPRRGPAVPSYIRADGAPLLYMPVRGGPEAVVAEWLSAIGDGTITEMSQADVRKWMRKTPKHRSFTIVTHPVLRAHRAFCHRILNTGEGSFRTIRQVLKQRYKLPLPADPSNKAYDKETHRAAFAGFLRFLKSNLSGQTGIRIDPAWASQTSVLQGFSDFIVPDMVMREMTCAREAKALAEIAGVKAAPEMTASAPDVPYDLADIYDVEIEELARDAYQRDYLNFGFRAWR